MAVIVVAATGNWSAVVGATTAADEVRTNGKAVTLDVANITAQQINAKDAGGTQTAGSLVIPAAATRTINASLYAGTAALIATATGKTLNVVGNLTGGTTSGGANAVNADGGGTVNVTGNVYGGVAGHGLAAAGAAQVTITGNVYGAAGRGLYIQTGGTVVTVNGNIQGAPNGVGCYLMSGATLILNGNLDESNGCSALTVLSTAAFIWNPPAGAVYVRGGRTLIQSSDLNLPATDAVDGGLVYGPVGFSRTGTGMTLASLQAELNNRGLTQAWAGSVSTLTLAGVQGELTARNLSAGLIAVQVETQILDEGDNRAILQAIADKIAASNLQLDEVTVQGIAIAAADQVERVSGMLAAMAANYQQRGQVVTLPAGVAMVGDLSAARDQVLEALPAVDAQGRVVTSNPAVTKQVDIKVTNVRTGQ